jgi:hypothetical protein
MATISSRAPGLARLAREEAGGAPSLGAAGVNDSREMPVVAGAARVDTPRSRDAPRVGPPARTPEEDARLVDISDRASSPPRRAAPASLRLADLGIPAPVVDRFVASGVKSGLVYPWQRAAIDEGADGSSLVYCAPTSGGKSLVANVLLVRRLVRRMRSGRPARALVVLPFHSLVNEKVEDLKTILAPMYPRKRGRDGARGLEPVRGFAGESEGAPLARPPGPGQEAVAVTTIEKASITVSRLAQEGRLHELCAVVVDELHMVGEEGRGAKLEETLAKIRFAARTGALEDPPQIVAMSATVSHASLERLAGWLDARLFVTNFRPVPLREHVASRGVIYRLRENAALEPPRANQEAATPKENVAPSKAPGRRASDPRARFDAVGPTPASLAPDALVGWGRDRASGPDGVAARLAAEAFFRGDSCLVFCPSRKKAEDLAEALAAALGRFALPGSPAEAKKTAAARQLLERRLIAAADGFPDRVLLAAAKTGVGFHHARLRAREKEAIEDGFRRGAVRVLACTTTLAAGVNLPAKRVVILEGFRPSETGTYRQMAGRAGRAGLANAGEAFVVPGPSANHGARSHAAPLDAANDESRFGNALDDASAAAFGLVASRLPELRSRLLEARDASTRGDAPDAEPDRNPSREDVQRVAALALQCVAAGTFKTERDASHLLRSTFAFGRVADRARLRATLAAALRHLRDDLHLARTVYDREGRVEWAPTPRGEAAHRSALPIDRACDAYDDLLEAARNGLALNAKDGTSFGHLHLLFLCVPRTREGSAREASNPLADLDWSAWYDLLCHPRNARAVFELGEARLGVRVAFASRVRRAGGGGAGGSAKSALERDRHARFAAALALRDVLELGDATPGLAAAWARVAARGDRDVSVGTLLRLRADVAASAAMTANLAETAGWRGAAEMLSALAKDLDAGVTRELGALVAVADDPDSGWVMTTARARALWSAGLQTPGAVAEAELEDVAAAVARAERRVVVTGGVAGESAGGDEGGREGERRGRKEERGAGKSASANRAAREIVAACRALEARRLAAEAEANQSEGEEPDDPGSDEDADIHDEAWTRC